MTGNRTTAAGDTADELVALTPAILYTSLLMLIGSCGNALVFYVYGFRWQRTVTKIFIFSLAALDLMNSLICMPTEIAMLVKIVSFDAPEWCRITRFLTYTLNGSSSLILVAIAVDRYYKIHRPLNCFFTDRRAKRVCVGAVILAAGLSWPSLVFYGNLTIPIAGSDAVGVTCLVSDAYIDTWWPMVFYSVYFTCYLALVAAITVLYSLIAKQLVVLRRKQKERLRGGCSGLRSSTVEIPSQETVPLTRIIIDDAKAPGENDVTDHDVKSGTEKVALQRQPAESGVKSLGDILHETAQAMARHVDKSEEEDFRRRSVTFKLPSLPVGPDVHPEVQNGGPATNGLSHGAVKDEGDSPKLESNDRRSKQLESAEPDFKILGPNDQGPQMLGSNDQAQDSSSVMERKVSVKANSAHNQLPQSVSAGAFVRGGRFQMTLLRFVCPSQPTLREEQKPLDPPSNDVISEEDNASTDVVSHGKSEDVTTHGAVDTNHHEERRSDENDKEGCFSVDTTVNGINLDSNGGTTLASLLAQEKGLCPNESGMSSRNSFLMLPGGYPGGHTPTSRLPTPTDTPNPHSADNRPVRLFSALLLDRLSKKMAYRPAKTTRMLFAISIVFVVSFLPFFVIVLMRAAQGTAFLASLSDVEVVVVNIFIRSSFISNAANPIIYGLCNKQFRVECRQLIGRFSGRQSDVTVRVMEQTDDALGCANSN